MKLSDSYNPLAAVMHHDIIDMLSRVKAAIAKGDIVAYGSTLRYLEIKLEALKELGDDEKNATLVQSGQEYKNL